MAETGWSLEVDKAAAKLVVIVLRCVSEALQVVLCRSAKQYTALGGRGGGHFLVGAGLLEAPVLPLHL